MIAAIAATFTFLLLAGAGIVWGVRRDDRRHESRATALGGESGSAADWALYGLVGAATGSDGPCEFGDSRDSGGGD
jgi:hypothetical protein